MMLLVLGLQCMFNSTGYYMCSRNLLHIIIIVVIIIVIIIIVIIIIVIIIILIKTCINKRAN